MQIMNTISLCQDFHPKIRGKIFLKRIVEGIPSSFEHKWRERTKVETADENHSKIHRARSLQSEANNAESDWRKRRGTEESKINNLLFANKHRMKCAFTKSESNLQGKSQNGSDNILNPKKGNVHLSRRKRGPQDKWFNTSRAIRDGGHRSDDWQRPNRTAGAGPKRTRPGRSEATPLDTTGDDDGRKTAAWQLKGHVYRQPVLPKTTRVNLTDAASSFCRSRPHTLTKSGNRIFPLLTSVPWTEQSDKGTGFSNFIYRVGNSALISKSELTTMRCSRNSRIQTWLRCSSFECLSLWRILNQHLDIYGRFSLKLHFAVNFMTNIHQETRDVIKTNKKRCAF